MKSDEDLMKEYQGDSYPAFQELYNRYSGKIYGYLLQRLSDRQKAADVFQQVFMKLHQSKHSYTPDLPFAPWLFTVCHRTLLDHLKSAQNKMEASSDLFDDERHEPSLRVAGGDSGGDFQNIQDPEHGLDGMIDQLPKAQQEVLKMRYLDELTFTEISDRLEQSEVTIRKRISRAIAQLRKLVVGRRDANE